MGDFFLIWPSLCIRSIMVTLGVDFDWFLYSGSLVKKSKSTPRVTMQLLIDKEGGILYILFHIMLEKIVGLQFTSNSKSLHGSKNSLEIEILLMLGQ